MKIKNLQISGIGGISELELNFNDGFNVICGANGIGKTTILDTIADAFGCNVVTKLRRNSLCNSGKYKIEIEIINNDNTQVASIQKQEETITFDPVSTNYHSGWEHFSDRLLNFGIERNFDYQKLPAVSSDPERQAGINGSIAVYGIASEDIKNWFLNRYMFIDKKGSLSDNQIENYFLAKDVFGILDQAVKFKTILARSYDIMLDTSKGDIYFEYLSSGYKSCLYIILGIIKEIEYRFVNVPKAKDFDGVILIDEIDLHLHPTWQAKLIAALKITFPKSQFIVTTHSPSILQSLQKEEIIALGSSDNGETYIKKLDLGEYGLQGWTLEEILKDVMEMPATTSEVYQSTIDAFDKAMDEENVPEIKRNYEILDKMLHPNSTLRKLLRIQMAGLEE